MEAVLLVGGAGTRLRPLTLSTPKPMLPVANYPCTAHQIAKAKAAGVTRIILSTSYKAEVFEGYFGAGEEFGIEIVYVTEDSPLGTGGAIRNVADALHSGPNDPVVILNGDILSGHDIANQVRDFQQRNADVSLHLINVEDPRPFGLVPTSTDNRVLAFLEKPQTPAEIVTHQVNAGCYVFKKAVIDAIPSNRVVSVERETFPQLLSENANVVGYVEDAYWLDLGTPLAFAQGSRDLVLGIAPSPLVVNPGSAIVAENAVLAENVELTNGSAVAENARIHEDSTIDGSVIMAGAIIEKSAQVVNSIVGKNALIGERVTLRDTVIADGAVVGADNELVSGARVWADVVIPERAIRFSPEN